MGHRTILPAAAPEARKSLTSLLVVSIVSVLSCGCGRTKSSNDAPSETPSSQGASSQTSLSQASTEGSVPDANVNASADNTSTTGEAGDTAGSVWTFGSDLLSVISSPVSDDDGNLYVAVGLRNEAKTNPELPAGIGSPANIHETRVVSLTADGRERWRSDPICTAKVQIEEYASVAVQADAVFALCGTLVKLDAAGKTLWTVSGMIGHGIAVGSDGTSYARRDDMVLAYSAVDEDGATRWTTTVGYSVSDALRTMTGPHTSVVVSRDRVFAPCDGCSADRGGVASLAPSSGAPTSIIDFAGVPNEYGALATTASGSVFILSRDLYTYDGSSVSSRAAGTQSRTVLVDATGPVYVVTGPGTTRQLRWGDKAVSALPTDPVGGLHEAVALLEPDLVLLSSGVALDKKGAEAFTLADANLQSRTVLPRNGDIVYVTKNQRLVSRRFPVHGFKANAPWPTPAGNAQGNHRVD